MRSTRLLAKIAKLHGRVIFTQLGAQATTATTAAKTSLKIKANSRCFK